MNSSRPASWSIARIRSQSWEPTHSPTIAATDADGDGVGDTAAVGAGAVVAPADA
jgi:hypothetical protein